MSVSLIAARIDTPQDARQVRSRNALCGALLELLQETAFDQITIREISARAGTGYATFFRHYPTKEALLGDVAAEEICTLMEMTDSMMNAADRFGSILEMCSYVDDHRKLWSALLTGGAAGIVREEMLRQAGTLGDESQCPDWLPPDLGRHIGVSSAIDVLVWWLGQKEPYTPEQIAVILDRLVISPVMDTMFAGQAPVSG
ncbi:MAG: TetR/AcrR family transcriptional regulator [Novosphingobium sp.]|nr:TetR/AcrR family transcriptional regulator [Novosphingobium sp.]